MAKVGLEGRQIDFGKLGARRLEIVAGDIPH